MLGGVWADATIYEIVLGGLLGFCSIAAVSIIRNQQKILRRDFNKDALVRLEEFWNEGADIPKSMPPKSASSEWAQRVDKYLVEIGELDEAVMFRTLSEHKDRMNKLRRIMGRAGVRAKG
jgi:hypothetical protein